MLQGVEVSGFRAHSWHTPWNAEHSGQVLLSSQKTAAEGQVKNSHGTPQTCVLRSGEITTCAGRGALCGAGRAQMRPSPGVLLALRRGDSVYLGCLLRCECCGVWNGPLYCFLESGFCCSGLFWLTLLWQIQGGCTVD